MKTTKLMLFAIVSLFAVEGFTQSRSCGTSTNVYFGSNYSFASNSNFGSSSKIRFYARELRLSRRQARHLDDILFHYNRKIDRVRSDRFLSRRSKRYRVNDLLERRELEVRDILSRRQYAKYRHIRNFENYRRDNWRCHAHGHGCSNTGCYDSFFRDRYHDGWDNYWNRDRQRDWDNRHGGWDSRDDRHHDRDRRDDYDRDRRGDYDDDYDDDRRRSDRKRDDRNRGAITKNKELENDDFFKDVDTKDDDLVDEKVEETDLEEELDDYFKDEFDYGDDEEADDYFANEN